MEFLEMLFTNTEIKYFVFQLLYWPVYIWYVCRTCMSHNQFSIYFSAHRLVNDSLKPTTNEQYYSMVVQTFDYCNIGD